MANPHETTSPPADRSGADVAAMTERIRESSLAVSALLSEIRKVIVGQSVLVERLVIGLLADGHVLLEGVPGLAKTLAVRTLSRGLHASFSRIQFTPDLLPADLVGTLVFNPKTQEFVTRRGPVFAHILLADEINRAPAKVQSALLEAMQERQVTIGDTTHPLPDPFLVLATQNPIEQEGTYPLPEAQVDRFLMKLRIGYPTKADERQILERMGSVGDAEATASVRPVLSPEQIRDLRALVRKLYADERIKGYLVELVAATREPKAYGLPELADFISYGASPRATLALLAASRAHAFLQGRGYVVPEDVKEVAPDVLRHRVLLGYEAEAENMTSDQVIARILERVEVP
ncbi:MAG: MoxR family ATPase [Acidobacteria bacterium]|nr:MAG: MoxR family ATPase [Acidobacteriota bacterium]MCE7959183.1 MoxR family ATPase [Acidobacteria bacterium ACB2]